MQIAKCGMQIGRDDPVPSSPPNLLTTWATLAAHRRTVRHGQDKRATSAEAAIVSQWAGGTPDGATVWLSRPCSPRSRRDNTTSRIPNAMA